jgi:hypothetical protein
MNKMRREQTMEKKSEMSFYSFVSELVKQFTYGFVPGLQIEMRHFLEKAKERKEIREFEFTLDIHKKCYNVKMYLEVMSIAKMHNVFLEFHGFIAYTHGTTIYTSKETSNGRHYLLVLLKDDGPSCYCEIDFIG